MASLLHLLLLPLVVLGDRSCGSSLSDLWLDVVLVVDNTQTQQQLDDIKSVSLAVFGTSRIGTTGYQDTRTTRIGIVDGSSNVIADLDAIQSTQRFRETIDALKRTENEAFDITKSLEAAEKILELGRANGERSSFKQLVVVLGKSSPSISIINRLESTGMSVISVSKNADASGKLQLNDENLAAKLSAVVLAANCYCPAGWVQVQAKFGDPNSEKFGTCLKPVNAQLSWNAAKLACQNLIKKGYLVTESTAAKHDFSAALANSVFPGMISYHIGLNYVNGGWYWQQPENTSLVKLGTYSAWYQNYPRSFVSETGVMGTGNAMGVVSWMNINANYYPATYMCEVAACDTSNKC